MTWPIRVVPDAEVELEASLRWYAANTPLRAELVVAPHEAVFAIAEQPLRYPLWRPGAAYRKYVVQKFPYLVIYRVRSDHVEIIAFAHTRRRPGYWTERG